MWGGEGGSLLGWEKGGRDSISEGVTGEAEGQSFREDTHSSKSKSSITRPTVTQNRELQQVGCSVSRELK